MGKPKQTSNILGLMFLCFTVTHSHESWAVRAVRTMVPTARRALPPSLPAVRPSSLVRPMTSSSAANSRGSVSFPVLAPSAQRPSRSASRSGVAFPDIAESRPGAGSVVRVNSGRSRTRSASLSTTPEQAAEIHRKAVASHRALVEKDISNGKITLEDAMHKHPLTFHEEYAAWRATRKGGLKPRSEASSSGSIGSTSSTRSRLSVGFGEKETKTYTTVPRKIPKFDKGSGAENPNWGFYEE